MCTLIIAIDGPAGSGKSSTAKAVAEALGYAYLDTGAMYRTAALAIRNSGVSATDEKAARILDQTNMHVSCDRGSMSISLNGQDVSTVIREPDIGTIASQVSALPELRARLVEIQQQLIASMVKQSAGVVVEGRDIGTVVAPDARLKVFMTASIEERARRRVEQLQSRGIDVLEANVAEEIRQRDERDRTRDVGPLKVANDAIVLDTTDMNLQQQIDFIVQHVTELN